MITKNLKNRILTSLILLFILILTIKFYSVLIISVMFLGIISIIEFFNINEKICKNKYKLFLFNFISSLYIFLFCLMFVFISSFFQLKLLLFLILLGCIASDIGGYIFGKIFKGPKLIKISPNKTYSGSIGSIFLTSITYLSFSNYLASFSLIKILLLAIITSVTCQIGDLIISFFKRKAKIKNTGNLLPGHGGILDRLDGVYLGIPFGFFAFVIIY